MAAFFSPSSPTRRWTYDVFLSFRGKDTRKTFTDHLYFALKDAGVNAFRDDNELRRGKDISSELLKAIRESRISVIVFSVNYADSRWCLEELGEILECRKRLRQLVLPIFYGVDPSDVRKQRGSFEIGEAFVNKLGADMEKLVSRWKSALTEAANLSGWELSKTCNGHEAKFIKKIVAKILQELNHTYLHVANHPVGLDSRVRRMNLLLSLGSNDIRIVGILGMSGMGKTTIAKAVYNQFFHCFDGKSFLENVSEISKQPDGLIHLQENLLLDILKSKKVKVGNVDRGITVIKERLCNRRVLAVVDDVDQIEQLNAIARRRDWFGLGSRIIVTTRDEHLLKTIEADEIYRAEGLNDEESLELFSCHAFGKNAPIKEDYGKLSKDLISYSGGLPLALEVLGSFLRDKEIFEWKDALEKLKMIPHEQILNKLQISFDALEDDKLKDIFLDIACFFIGVDKDYAVTILDGCGLFSTIGIGVLTCRCLVAVNRDNKLRMHDFLRDTGREIVRKESLKDPGRRSRLWFHQDVLNILEKHTGTDSIEGLTLNLPRSSKVHRRAEAFVKMQNLRLLQLNHLSVTGDYKHLPKELVWLCWHGFPLKHIPNNFQQANLVAIDMQYSNLRQVWKDTKVLEKLKVLNLSHSHYLTSTPDFLLLPNLEKLMLKDCKNLVEVHQSIGSLDKLVLLEVKDCPNLKNLPRSVCKLKLVVTLDLSGCLTIDQLPEDIGDMESLTRLLVDNTAIRQVPFSIVRLKNLMHLSLRGCRGTPSSTLPSLIWSWLSSRRNHPVSQYNLLPTSLSGLSSLTELSLRDCNLSHDAIPNDLGNLSCLRQLDLSGNNFVSLPDSMTCLYNLIILHLDRCTRLESLPELPSSIMSLWAKDCSSLERLPMSNFTRTPDLFLGNCHRLTDVPGLEKMEPAGDTRILMQGCNSLSKTFKETLFQKWSTMRFWAVCFPGKDIPDWFGHQSMSSSLSFQVPLNPACTMKGFVLCIVYSANSDSVEAYPAIKVINKTKTLDWTYLPPFRLIEVSRDDHLWVIHLPPSKLCKGDLVVVEVELGEEVNVNRCGIHLVLEQVTKSDEDSIVEVDEEQVSIAGDQLGAHGKRGHEDDDGPPRWRTHGQAAGSP
ncbi:disease resistance protein RUN1 [Actinidia eriantha]|uniref:disease resistance protein RUN1 n=1 Tax=Actinidia eriantha TaxID=165200 RepID=UPI002587DF9D|nr:disease resistance protein RUN1 [Actinidia eriantha]